MHVLLNHSHGLKRLVSQVGLCPAAHISDIAHQDLTTPLKRLLDALLVPTGWAGNIPRLSVMPICRRTRSENYDLARWREPDVRHPQVRGL